MNLGKEIDKTANEHRITRVNKKANLNAGRHLLTTKRQYVSNGLVIGPHVRKRN
jgi:hypothetical protein